MSQDRNEKYAGQEESEYHFSDEDISYEVDTEAPKPTVVSEPKENFFSRLSRSKRIGISLVVFLALVFIVYKMVAPTSTTPPTEIVPPATVAEQQRPALKNPNMPEMQANQAAPNNVAVTTQTTTTQAPSVMQPAMSQPVPANVQPTMAQSPQAAQQPVMPPAPQQTPQAPLPNAVMPENPTVAAPQPQPAATSPQPVAQPVAPQAPQLAQQPLMQQQAMPSANMPASTAPMQQPPQAPSFNPSQPSTTALEANRAAPTTMPPSNVGQLQSEYAQRLNDFTAQNKALQDQIQLLNTRVAGMEAQMNQLVQALLRQNQSSAFSNVGSVNAVPAPQPERQAAPEPRVAYSVQAIIPGRAWLRSDNGETVTVAEGDVIKDLGRVTKIDPYDGIVEVNTGSKVISLSYGNGG